MCADNFSPRQQTGPGRHRRNSSSRQRPSLGPVRLFENPPGATPPPVRPAPYVGRVGALAVALGVGTAILSFTAPAAADTGRGDALGATESPGGESSRPGNSRPASDKTRAGNRRGAPRRAPGSSSEPNGAPEVPTSDLAVGSAASTGPVTPSSRFGGVRPDATAQDTLIRKTGGSSAVSAHQTPADSPQLASPLSPGGVQDLVQDKISSWIGNLFTTTESAETVVEAARAPEITSNPLVAALAAVPEAPEMNAAPTGAMAAADADPSALLGAGTDGMPAAEPLAWAALAAARREDLAGTTPEVAPAAAVSTGEPQDPAMLGDATADGGTVATSSASVSAAAAESTDAAADPAVTPGGDVTAAPTFDVPPVPSGCNTVVCTTLSDARGLISNKIAAAVVAALPQSALGPDGQPALGCGTGSGNAGKGKCGVSPANYIAAYSFNIIYSLMGGFQKNAFAEAVPLPDTTVGSTVQALFSQPQILTFISRTVGAGLEKSLSTPLGTVPPDVALTVGNAVATFVQDSFGTSTVANELVPFLRALNIPYKLAQATIFASAASKDVFAAILKSGNREINPAGMLTALQNLFSSSDAQNLVSSSAAQSILQDAVTNSISVLLGLQAPPFSGAPQVPPTAVADYIGQVGAEMVLGPDNPDTAALATTIGSAVQGLFSSIGGDVAAQAGVALVAFLNAPDPDVPTTLATFVVNGFVEFLQNGAGQTPVPPFPNQPPLLPALAPAAGVAVSSFVSKLLSIPAVPAGVGTFITQLITGLADDAAVRAEIGQQVGTLVTSTLGGGPLAVAVGPQVGAAVQSLLANPVVVTALSSTLGALVPAFLSQDGVVAALATAAGQLATAALDGTLPTVLPEVQAQLQASTAIQTAAGVTVTDAATQLLSNSALLQALDTTAVSLVTGLLADNTVQNALQQEITDQVSKLLGGGDLGQVVGTKVATAVVGLLTSPAFSAALVGLVDTVTSDFFGAPGVVSALADAAGQLATAAVAGDLATVLRVVAAALKANPDIDAAIGVAVGGAVTELLSDATLWQAVDATAISLITELLADPTVQDAVGTWVANAVNERLGLGPISVVGDQVGAAVVALMANPVVSAALVGLVDTVATDFFNSPGVIPAVAEAADTLALAVLTGKDFVTALQDALSELGANPAIQTAVGTTVTGAVGQLLNDTALWRAIDGQVTNLITELFGDQPVRDAVAAQVAAGVSAALGGGDLGDTVGAQVGDTVAALMANPVVSAALVGLVDTVTTDFFTTDGVVSALAEAAGELATAAVAGDLDTVRPLVQAQLRANAAIQEGVQRAVGDAVTELLSDATLWQAVDGQLSTLITELLADQPVQDAVGTWVANAVNERLGLGPVSVVGDQVGAAVVALMANPVVSAALVGLVDTVATDFFNSPGVIPAVAEAASNIALAVLTGEDLTTALQDALGELEATPAIQTAVGTTLTDAVDQLLSNTALVQALGDTLSTLVTDLVDSPAVQQYAGDQVAALVTTLLGQSPIAEPVGQALGAAVQQFLATPGIGAALGPVIGSVLPDFLDQTGVPTAIAEAAGNIAVALLTGKDLTTALQDALIELEANPEVKAALKITIADALALINTTMLSDPTIQQALGSITTTLIENLAASAAVRAFVAERLGPTLGPAVAELLANTAVVDDVATAFGSAVTQFLAYPGFSTALTDAINQFADAVIDGTPAITALQDALTTLEANPAFRAAVEAILPNTLNALLKNPAVREAIADATRTAVIDLLKDRGITNPLIDAIAGQVAGATVDSFLAKPTGQALIDSIVIDVFNGMPISEVTDTVIQAVLHDPGLQTALGTSIGTGIGSLFGDNIVGLLVGGAAGITATIAIAIASGLTLLLNGNASTPDPATTPDPAATTSHFLQPPTTPSDPYTMTAVIPDLHATAPIATNDPLVLTEITTTQPDIADIQLTITTPANTDTAQLRVAFSFTLNQLLTTPTPRTQARGPQPV